MVEELLGPILSVYAYPEAEFEQTLELCDKSSPYALTAGSKRWVNCGPRSGLSRALAAR